MAEDIDRLHDAIIAQDPHDRKWPGTQKPGAVESIVARGQPPILATDGDLFVASGWLLREIALAHPYQQGNKRTALGAAVATLRANGWSVEVGRGEAARFMRHLTAARTPLDEVVGWLSARARRL